MLSQAECKRFALFSAQKILPQITLIDADNITNCVGLYLRYLRHLRARSGRWVDRASSIEHPGSVE